MKGFWTLFRKEVRFLAGPGIALIVLFLSSSWLDLFSMAPTHYLPSPIEQYIIRPLAMISSSGPLYIDYIYGTLFLYVLMYEHIVKTRQQLLMLPIKRWWHIVSKVAAVLTWFAIYRGIIGLDILGLIALHVVQPPGSSSFAFLVITNCSLFSVTASLVSLIAAGYIIGMLFPRIPYLVGTVVIILGYTLIAQLRAILYQSLIPHSPGRMGVSALQQVTPWFDVYFPAVVANDAYGADLYQEGKGVYRNYQR